MQKSDISAHHKEINKLNDMRNIFLLITIAAIVFTFVSCSQDNSGTKDETINLTVRITNTSISGRAVEAPGTAVAATLTDGWIFLVSSTTGNVVRSVELNVGEALQSGAGTGQIVTGVPSNARIYIVGNLPGAYPGNYDAIKNLATLSAIQNYVLNTEGQDGRGHTGVTLANESGNAIPINHVSGATTASVSVNLSPLVGRLELVSAVAVDYTTGAAAVNPNRTYTITGFTVTGVFADNYYEEFTLAGVGDELFSQGTEFKQFDGIGDEDSWGAVAGTAIPGNDNVWAYNLPAMTGNMPRLILRLENISASWSDSGGSGTVNFAGQIRFVTVVSYRHNNVSGAAITAFERGNIYRINGVQFNINNLSFTPNPSEDVTVTTDVDVLDWNVEDMYHNL